MGAELLWAFAACPAVYLGNLITDTRLLGSRREEISGGLLTDIIFLDYRLVLVFMLIITQEITAREREEA